MLNKLLCLPYDAWVQAFLPPQEHDAGIDDKAFDGLFDGVPLGETEPKMYDPFVKAVNGAGILADFVLAKTSAKPALDDKDGLKVDGGMYPKDCPAVTTERTDWASVEVFIECKPDNSYDPYDETTKTGFPFADDRRNTLGQISTYASRVFEYQQLTHHFGVVLLGSWARLGRWDRSGVVFSSVFDYKQEPAKLARFFYRVAHASAEARGHDPTATRVVKGSEDYKILQGWAAKAKAYAEDPSLAQKDYVGKQFVDSLNRARAWWRLRVVDDEHGVKEFLVGKPTFAAPGVIGRGTRGYIGLSISDPGTPFVYLKDCWRVVHDRSELEGDILSYLNAKGVKNIPTALYHGDVADQRTVSQDFCTCAKSGCAAEVVVETGVQPMQGGNDVQNTDGNHGESVEAASAESGTPLQEKAVEGTGQRATAGAEAQTTQKKEVCRLKTHRHYRLVVREVGLPLKEFPCGRILVWSIRDAIIAHQDAYEKAKMMHRDISVGNILIIPSTGKDGKTSYQGLLADWELSKRLDDYEKDARHPDRTGTWQFMSVRIQTHPETQVEIADELESFLHVMIYCAIRYLPHTCENVGDFMYRYFDDGLRRGEAEYTCGACKRMVMESGVLKTLSNQRIVFLRHRRAPDDEPPTEDDLHPIEDLLAELLQYFSARYILANGALVQPSRKRFAAYLVRDGRPRGLLSQDPETRTKLEERYELTRTHSPMIAMLEMASDKVAYEWPGPEDRLPDQLKPDYKPNKLEKIREKRSAPDDDAQQRSASKRHRSAASASRA
ncbi:hypothetical protein PYCCODRAFT_1479342 [Trametes coccinea BRFM310]|uniref:Fungal-type protein kinase domain-containing protein n=1 Tax=Trametes coccinea (strain BRFM310) TaxID=1353009 RepID=A0A1Y2IGJ0_TRAC3|nr:hypothetical protein PYCCODRAFT_1479342 [Trametes coccinea BRFM310]